VWTKAGLFTYYVLFFVHLATQKVHVAGVTPNPDAAWMTQMARNVTLADEGYLSPGQRLIHDRDANFSAQFIATVEAAGVEAIKLPARSPNLNAIAERWIRSVKDDCISKVILFGERSLRRALEEYQVHYHRERNHQGKGNVLLFPDEPIGRSEGRIRCRERLGGLLKYYYREAG
jgi:putative transposase